MSDDTVSRETWENALADVRDELFTVAFFTEDDLGDWLDNPHDFGSVQDWAMSFANKLQALYKLISNALTAERERAKEIEADYLQAEEDCMKAQRERHTAQLELQAERERVQTLIRGQRRVVTQLQAEREKAACPTCRAPHHLHITPTTDHVGGLMSIPVYQGKDTPTTEAK